MSEPGTLVAEIEANAQVHADTFVGRAVRRQFCTGWFTGAVISARVTRFGDYGMQTMWRVRYRGGSCEDLTWQELRDALAETDAVDADAGAPADGGGAAEHCIAPAYAPAAPADGDDAARRDGGTPVMPWQTSSPRAIAMPIPAAEAELTPAAATAAASLAEQLAGR